MSSTQTKISKSRRITPVNQELNNPCFKEYNQSLKCLEKNFYDHDKCEMYFANYRTCKKFWGAIVSDRKSKDIQPNVPLPEEREKIKVEYLNSKHR